MPSPILPLKLRGLSKLWWTSKVGKVETSLWGAANGSEIPRFSSRYGQQTSPKPLFLDGALIFFFGSSWFFPRNHGIFFPPAQVWMTCTQTRRSTQPAAPRASVGATWASEAWRSSLPVTAAGHGKLGPEREPKKQGLVPYGELT